MATIQTRRVVITGMGFLSPLGHNWNDVKAHFLANRGATSIMSSWGETDLLTHLACPAAPFRLDKEIFSRKRTRAMGRVALMATKATYDALADARLLEHESLTNGACGIAYGSSAGQPQAALRLVQLKETKSTRGITATTYVRMMSHTAAVNIGVFFGVKGCIIPTSSACTSGSQGIGMAYRAIRFGRQDVMIAGGAEELDITDAAIFDTLFATSTRFNDTPEKAPRPFDHLRDGLVIGEGAGTLILESLRHAQARGAKIYAEVIGFGQNSDGSHITTPQSEGMAQAMRLALRDAQCSPEAIDYINGHGTATINGDQAESAATYAIFGDHVPYSTYKGHMGHTLGASGALEAIFSICGMRENIIVPTLHLRQKAEDCAPLRYVMHQVQPHPQKTIMTNNFAFGGINTSLILRRWDV